MKEFWNTPEAKQFFREKREERGLTQRDLAEKGFSVATVSNIEKIKHPYVSRNMVEKYCSKLGLDLDDIPHLIGNQKNKEEPMIGIKLKAIETLIGVDLKKAKSELENLDISSSSPHDKAHFFYLQGCYWGKRKSWRRAENALYKSIQIVNDNRDLMPLNLQSVCYYQLSRHAAWQNDLKQSLKHVAAGLSCFCKEDGAERTSVEFSLLISRVIYSRQLGHDGEAKQTLHKMQQRQDETNTEIKLNMAVEQAQLYNKEKMYESSIDCIYPYIDIARKEHKYDRLMELWAILGVAYKQIGDIVQAKICLKTAEQLENQVKNNAFTGHTYIELGRLYLDEGDVSQAKETIQKGLKLCKDDAVKYLYGMHSLAECYEYEDKREAIRLYEKAVEITERHNLEIQRSKIFLQLARLCERINSVKYKHYLDAFFRASIQVEKATERGVEKLTNSHLHSHNSAGEPPDE